MLQKPSGFGRVAALALAGLSVAVAALAAEVSPPPPSPLDTKLLQGFEGYYQSAAQEVIHITRDGQRLFMQFTGRPRQEIWAASATELSDAKGQPAATATRDAQGQATRLVMHRRSLNFDARRISPAQADEIADAVAARIRKQEAAPGTEAALKRMFCPGADGPSQARWHRPTCCGRHTGTEPAGAASVQEAGGGAVGGIQGACQRPVPTSTPCTAPMAACCGRLRWRATAAFQG